MNLPSLGSSGRTRGACAVVTGAGSGIGEALALELGRRGGRVVCADIDEAAAHRTAARVASETGGDATAVRCDVSRLDDVIRLADAAEAWLGEPVDLVTNNAGVGVGGRPIGEIPIDDWVWALGVNLWGVIHGCHVFVPRLRALGRGGVLNVASAASFTPAPTMGPYSTGKAAVLALSETLAAELAGTGIAVSVLCPTFVQTNITANGRIDPAAAVAAERAMARTGRSAADIARAGLDGLDRGRLHLVPQLEAKLLWGGRRLAPSGSTHALGALHRLASAHARGRRQEEAV